MQRGQDWCLECGTAAPGRLGARPGWRAAFTVVGLTTVLLVLRRRRRLRSADERRRAHRVGSGQRLGNPIVAGTPGAATTPPRRPPPSSPA